MASHAWYGASATRYQAGPAAAPGEPGAARAEAASVAAGDVGARPVDTEDRFHPHQTRQQPGL